MRKTQTLWIAVKTWRGTPDEVKGFRNRAEAEKQEQAWREVINPDYDATAVIPLVLED